jgi:hypothetical protein
MRVPPLLCVLATFVAVPLPAQGSRPVPAPAGRDLRRLVPADARLVASTPSGTALWNGLESLVFPLPGELGQRLGPKVGAGKLALAAALGTSLEAALELLAVGQVVLAFVPTASGDSPLALARVGDGDHAAVTSLLDKAGKGAHARIEGGVLRVAAKPEALERVRRVEAGAERSWFESGAVDLESAADLRPAGATVTLDLEALRQAAPGQPGLGARLDAGGRFLLGPIAAQLDAARFLTAHVRVGRTGISALATTVGSEPGDSDPVRALLPARPASVVPLPADGIAAMTLARSLHGLFTHLDTLLSEEDAAKAKSSLSIADALLGGRSLVRDLLPALGPISLYVLPEPGAPGEPGAPRPTLRLPGLALCAEVTTERAKGMLKTLFANLATIQAAERTQQGKLPYTPRLEEERGYRMQTLAIEGWEGTGASPVEVGLSPTLLLAHGHAILASTSACALRLAEEHALARSSPGGDAIVVHGKALAALADLNARPIALGRMLDEGEGPDEAAWFAKALGDALRAVESFRISVQSGVLTLEIERSRR